MLNDKAILVDKMVISAGNENDTHFSITYETESILSMALATGFALRLICFGQQVNQIYLRVKRFKN